HRMMCHRMGRPPISTSGLGRRSVSSARRLPRPPAKIPTFMAPVLGGPEGTEGHVDGAAVDFLGHTYKNRPRPFWARSAGRSLRVVIADGPGQAKRGVKWAELCNLNGGRT